MKPVEDGQATTERAEVQSLGKFAGWRQTLDVPGRLGWRARYFKEVDADERTVKFWQEIYDDQNRLVEIHEKYPVDKGHRKL